MEIPRLRKRDVIKILGHGGVKRTATALGYSRVTIWNWGEFLPEGAARRVLDAFPQMHAHVVDPKTGLSPADAAEMRSVKKKAARGA